MLFQGHYPVMVYMIHCSFLEAICPWVAYRCTAIFSFLRAVLVTSVIGLTFLPLWFGSHSDYSQTAPTAPSLRPLIPSGSLIRCQSVQVYNHHPRCRVPMDAEYHITYPGYYLVQALPWGLERGQLPLHAGWVTQSNFVTFVVAHAVGQSVITSFHPVTGQLLVFVGINVDVVWMVH
jgi:hypothetical protein